MPRFCTRFLTKKSSLRLALVAITATSLSACAGFGASGQGQDALAASAKRSALYHVMVGEMAMQREQLPVAKNAYLTAMDMSDDKRVASTACRIALKVTDYENALRAADRWTTIDPSDIKGWRVGMMVCAQMEDPAGAAQRAKQLVKNHPDGKISGYSAVHAALTAHPKDQLVDPTYKALAALDTRESYPWTLRGLNAAKTGEYDLAQQYADKALSIDAQDSRAKILKAQVWAELGKATQAIKYLDAEVAKNPKNIDLRLSYAKYLLTVEDKAAARQQYERALALDGSNVEALFAAGLLDYEQSRLVSAKELFTRLRESAEKNDDEKQADVAYFYLGQVAEDQQLYVTAAEYFSKVTGEREMEAMIGVGRLHFKAERFEEGHLTFADLRDLYPRKREAMWSAEAEALARLKHFKRSAAVFTSGLAERPHAAQLLLGRSHVWENLEQTERALADLRKAHEVAPNHPLVLNAFGYALTNYTKQYEEALAYIQQALELNPRDPSFLDSLGWVQLKLGKVNEALKNLAQAHAMLPAPEVAAHYGEALWQAGSYHQAETVWRAALHQTQNDNAIVRQTMERLRQ